MKSFIGVIAAAFLLSLVSAGCYTQLASRGDSRDRYEDEEEYTSTDQTDTSGTVVNNYYFGDDTYRYNRFHRSFSYYHPGRWAYCDGFYDPWYDDMWFWPYSWRPYVLYPYPTWYPYDSYYGYYPYWGSYPYWGNNHHWGYNHYGYNGGGHDGSIGGRNDGPNRPRLIGTTRGGDATGLRTRNPIVTPAGPVTTLGGTTPTIRTRTPDGGQRNQPSQRTDQPVTTRPTRTRGNDTPWWERSNPGGGTTQGTQTSTQPSNTGERRRRQVDQAPGTTQQSPSNAPSGSRNEGTRERRVRNSDAAPRQQNVATPAAQPQPRYTPAPNNGGGRSSGGSSGGSSSGRSSSGGSQSSGSGQSSSGGGRQRSGR